MSQLPQPIPTKGDDIKIYTRRQVGKPDFVVWRSDQDESDGEVLSRSEYKYLMFICVVLKLALVEIK